MVLVAIYALVWSVHAVLMFAAFRWIAPRSQPSFAHALVWSAALLALGELAAIAWEPGRVCVFAAVPGVILGTWAIRLVTSRAVA